MTLTRRFIANVLKVLGETGILVVQCNNVQVSSYDPLTRQYVQNSVTWQRIFPDLA